VTLDDYYADGTLEDALTPENLDLFRSWYLEWLKADYSPTTISTELSYVKTWIQDCQDRDADITEQKETDIKRYLRQRNAEISDSGLNSSTTAFRKWHEWMVETGRREDNPTEDIDLSEMFSSYNPGVSQRQAALNELTDPDELTTITPEDVDELAKYSGSPKTRNELLIRLGFQSAMRPAEIAWAKVDNIDWDDRTIRIRTAKAEPDHPYYQRYVFWHRDLDALMYRWIGGEDGGGEREAYQTHRDSEYIFLTKKKPKMRPEYVSRLVREAAERAGLQRELARTARQVPQNEGVDEKPDSVPLYQISGHELRRASLTHYVNKVDSIQLHEAQILAGHQHISQTRSYVHDDMEQLKRKMRTVTF
jgi:site-specific recombinase XerD